MSLTVDRVKELLDYSPETGIFRWRVARSNRIKSGQVAGSLDKQLGYIRISIDGISHLGHRLAYLYQTGSVAGEIDHKNLKRDDNRIANLRAADRSHNGANCRKRTNNKSGFKGVVKHRGKWRAKITLNGKTISLGSFDLPEQAHAVYCEASLRAFGEFARVA